MKKILMLLLVFTIALPYNAFASDDIADRLIAQLPALSAGTRHEVSEAGGNFTVIFYFEDEKSIAVAAKRDGTILGYNVKPAPKLKTKKSLPKLAKSDAFRIAADFVNAAASDITGQLNMNIYTNTYSFVSGGFNVRFDRMVNGISYTGDGVSVLVDGETGQVMRYSRVWNENMVFEPVDEIISHSEAEKSFKENIGLELRYGKRRENSSFVPYASYVPRTPASINALDGAAVGGTTNAPAGSYHEMLAMYEKTTMPDGVEIQDTQGEGLVSVRAAQIHARKIGGLGIDDAFTVNQARYYKNTDGEFLITLKFTKEAYEASVTLNAKTLDIIGFFNGETAQKAAWLPVDKEEAGQIADKFISENKPGFAAGLSQPQINPVQNGTNSIYSVLYERSVNSIPYKSNYISFLVNSNGDIISMASVWDNAEFDDLTGAITLEGAYDIFFKMVGLRLVYMQVRQDYALPVYTVNPKIPAIIDAKTGDILSYDGKRARPAKGLDYVGLEGHYAAVPATVLAEYDVFVSQGDVLLDDYILQKDFITMLSVISAYDMPVYEKQSALMDEELEMIYSSFVTSGVMEKEEEAPQGYVTRADAVKYLVCVAGYKEVAQLEGIFKMPFMDAHKIPPDLYGYVSLARGMGIISGSGGYFNPTQYLTNADALILIFNYLK